MDNSIAKAFGLLELLAASEQPLGVTALAERASLGKSNVHRILQSLVELGYVQQNAQSHYLATTRLWEFGSQAMSRLSVRDLARPAMRALAELTNETVHLSELHEGEVLYIDKIESSEPVRTYTKLGGRAPAYCTATGKAMLAFVDAARVEQILASAEAHTTKTITSAEEFMHEVEKIRGTLFSLNKGEWRADVIGLAAPIAGGHGEVIAAVGLSAPASRLDLSELAALAPQVLNYARQISKALGCSDARWAALGSRPSTSESAA